MVLLQESHQHYQYPVFRIKNVDAFEPKIDDPPRIYEFPIGHKMRMAALVVPRMSIESVLRIGLHGAVPVKIKTGDFFFEPNSIYSESGDPYILFSDPTLSLDRSLRLAWFTGAAWVDPDDVMEKMIRKLGIACETPYFLVGGGSGGGFVAARLATRFKHAVASVKIPHTDLFRRPPDALSRALRIGWGWDRGRVLRTAPTRFRLADIYGDPRWNRGNLLHIVQHAGDRVHVVDHLGPFLRELGGNDFSHKLMGDRITISRPYIGEGHLPVPPLLWRAEDEIALKRLKSCYPNVPNAFIEESFVKPEGLKLGEAQLKEREITISKHYEI